MATLGSQTVGSTVKFKVNGTARDFIVVHQGRPSTAYDSSCNGTWLLMKDIYEQRPFDDTDNDYENSSLHSYLNSTFLNLIETNIRNKIIQAKIPYVKGVGSSGTLKTGANGLSAKIFLLSTTEYGGTSTTNFLAVGAVLEYFNGVANSVRKANFNGTVIEWWGRSPTKSSDVLTSAVNTNGSATSFSGVSSVGTGVRPAMILSTTLDVSSDGTIVVNTAPTTPGTPSVPSEASVGDAITVSWSASTDANGNLSGYELYASVNGGSWTQVYKGANRTYSYTIPDGTETLSFRVRAYDSNSAYSSYATSSTVAVSSGAITGSVNIGGVQRELTGKGYINIGGVLHELSDSKENIGGTLKSSKG